MRRLITTLAATVLAVGLAPSPSAATEPDLPRILLVGDSITQGKAGDVTWRYHLWNAFGGDVDLVGPKQGQAAEGGGDLEVVGQYPNVFDYDHAARWGMPMVEMDWTVADLVATYDSDVVVEQLGANDLYGYGQTPESLAALVRQFVADARSVKPDVDVVLGQVTWNWDATVQAYNALLPGIAADLDTPASRVVVAVMPPMTYADTYDQAHPNAQGEVKIATAHEAALRSLGIAEQPEPVAVTPPPALAPAPALEAPSKPRRVKAVDLGKRVKVKWRPAARAESYVARCGSSVKVTSGLSVRVRDDGRCKVRAVNAAGRSEWVRA